MAEETKAQPEKAEPAREVWRWVGMLLPPVTWSVQLQTLYLTSEYGCFTSNFFWNHIVSAAALFLSLIGLFISWRQLQTLGLSTEDESGNPDSRKRFMANLGLLGGALFSLVIIAQWLPTILEVPCDK